MASHWAYVLGGVEQCRAIVTFGTPFRGSPQAIQSLSVGVRKFGLDLTDLLRSFTSAYQLLPIYPCVSAGGEWHRPAETTVPGVDQRMAQDALTFHRAILDAAESSQGPYLRPYVGLRQDTTQSFAVDGNAPGTSLAPPPLVEAQFGSGDGTVPQVSAVPVQRSDALVDTSVVERHSVLQNNR
ncbi:MAG: hypothetical protein ABR616_18870, partial [Dermatophilaceae bacterium]